MSKKVKRLFEGFHPSNYIITLDPDRALKTLNGTVIITGKKIGRPSQRLTFHQRDLKISAATITRQDKKGRHVIHVDRINHQRSLDEVRLHCDELLYPGEYTIELTFAGKISRQMEGVYPCNFTEDGQELQLIATQFESHAARQAFPCIDEPEAKATFDLTLKSPVNETVIANTPIKTQSTVDNKLVTTFETTPVMSTYLLAFAYGALQHREATTQNGTLVRTFATRDNIAYTDFALTVAVRCLEYFEDYFAVRFPLPKCDFVALPDFAAGAMENWGLITFREQCLLVDPANTSLPNKQYVAEVICHELTHQWFGNLVTMKWWNDLWLNEGFANVMAYMAVDKLFPDWDMMTQYIVAEQQPALKLDALENTHPIDVTINHPDEIRTIFDAISYSKGGSCILMLRHYLGETAFRDGLRHYLKAHAYSNTTTQDLWDSLEKVSKKPVKQMMRTWTEQAGYPLVNIRSDAHETTISQQQFLMDSTKRATIKPQLWPIALNGGPNIPDMLQSASIAFDTTDYLKLNQGQTSFCRVIYDELHLRQLAQQVAKGKLGIADRLGILSDSFEAAKAGFTSTTEALRLMEAYNNEDSDIVWEIITGNLSSIRTVMESEDLRDAMKPFGRQLAAKQLARLGWEQKENEPHFDTLLRPTIISLAAASEDKTVVAEAIRRFKDMKNPEDLAPDLRGVIYGTAALHGNRATFDKLLEMLKTTTSAEESVTLAAALTGFKQPELIQRSLDLIISDTVRLQDTIYWIVYSLSNRFARQASWEWLKEHWGWLKENLGSDTSFSRLPMIVARVISNKELLTDYEAFFSSVMEPMIERAYRQGLEAINWQMAWRQRDSDNLLTYFSHYKPQTS